MLTRHWIVLAGVLALAVPVPAAADDIDDFLLRVERPVDFYAVLPEVARLIGPVLKVADKRSIPIVALRSC